MSDLRMGLYLEEIKEKGNKRARLIITEYDPKKECFCRKGIKTSCIINDVFDDRRGIHFITTVNGNGKETEYLVKKISESERFAKIGFLKEKEAIVVGRTFEYWDIPNQTTAPKEDVLTLKESGKIKSFTRLRGNLYEVITEGDQLIFVKADWWR